MTKHALEIGIARTPTDRKVLTEIPFGEGFVAFRTIKIPWSIRYWGIDYLVSFLHLPPQRSFGRWFRFGLGFGRGATSHSAWGSSGEVFTVGETLP